LKPKNKALESLEAAMGDRLLAEKPLTMAYGQSVIAEVTNYIESLESEIEAIRDAVWGLNYGSDDFHKNMRKADELRDARRKLYSKGKYSDET